MFVTISVVLYQASFISDEKSNQFLLDKFAYLTIKVFYRRTR